MLLLSFACRQDDEVEKAIEPGYDYFPLEIGFYRDYSLYVKNYFLRSDTTLNKLVGDSSEQYRFVRVLNAKKIQDIEGDSALRLEYYSKGSLGQDWSQQPDSVAVAKIKNSELIYEINNRTFVKLIFPVMDGIQWDGNKYNNLGEENYLLQNLFGAVMIGDSLYTNAIEVLQSDEVNLVQIDQRSEQYVFGVGMTRKNTRILQYRQSNGQILNDQVENGVLKIQDIIGYGNQ